MNQNPKITFGGYQEEGLIAPEQRFYSEVMHEIVSMKISGGQGWSVPLRNVNIGEKVNFTPRARSAQLDAGSGMVIFSQEDHKIIADSICDFVNDMKNNMTCVGRSDDYVKTGPLMLLNATPSLIAELPHIKIQLDSYNFDLRPEGYFHFIDTTPLTLNMTRPYPGNPNMTKTNPTGP